MGWCSTQVYKATLPKPRHLLSEKGGEISLRNQKHPNKILTSFFVDRPSLVDVYHFRSAVLERGVRANLDLELPHLLDGSRRRFGGRDTPEITQLETLLARLEDVFDLEVPMDKRFGGDRVHLGHPFAHVHKDLEDLLLRQPGLKSAVHQINDPSARTELHQDQHLVRAVWEMERVGVEKVDDVGVTSEKFL